MPSLKDIAKATGFSVSVVSRALNPKPDANTRMSPDTRDRILDVATQLGYRRNRHAEFLQRGRSPTIGIFMPRVANRLTADLVIGMSDAAAEHQFPLMLQYGLDAEDYLSFMTRTESLSHCGMITYPYFKLPKRVLKRLEGFQKSGGSVLTISSREATRGIPYVGFDDREAGALAGKRLASRGCKAVVVFGEQDFDERGGGCEEALSGAGIADASRVRKPEKLDAFLRGKPGPKGIFALSDRSALEAIRRVREVSSLVIGRDIHLVGCGDLFAMDLVDPPLTTVHLPYHEVGRRSIEKVVQLIYGSSVESEVIQPRLVVRQSG